MCRILYFIAFLIAAPFATAEEPPTVLSATVDSLTQKFTRLAEMRESGNQQPVDIVLADGVYRLDRTIELSSQLVADGLTIRALNPGKALFSGGRPLPPGKRDGKGRWRIELPEDWNQFNLPRQLVVDGRLSAAARHPNHGYLRIEKSLPDRRSGFVANVGDIPDTVSGNFDLVLLHDWSSSRLPVASYDKETRTLRSLGPIGCRADHYKIDHFEQHPRYWLEGHSVFADMPGEWFVDAAANEIVLLGDERQTDCPQVILPWLDRLLTATGDEAPVRNLVLEGITFTETRFAMPAGGYAGAQATMYEPRDETGTGTTKNREFVDAAVKIENAVGCRFTNCDFQTLCGSGLWIGGRTKDCKVFRCRFKEIGGNGLNLGEDTSRKIDGRTWYQAAPDQIPTNNRVEQCVISRCGRVLPGAVAIWASLHQGLEVASNRIHDCPYTGISLGWIWNDSESPAAENVIRDNRIEFVMQVLSDGGGIYTLGRQPNSVIVGNTITDVPLNAGRAESNAMFLDQGSTGFTIRDNVIRRIDRSPLRFHQAGKNVVAGNRWELAGADTPPVRFNKTPIENIQVEHNDVLSRETSYFLIGNSLSWDTVPSRLDGNVHWHVDCGKNLPYIHDHYQSPCVSSSRLWPTALNTTQYEYVSLQPHYGSSIEQDLAVISRWMNLQPKATIVIHTGWARHAEWVAEASDDDPSGPLTHSKAYFDELVRRLRERHPGREIRRTLAMDYLHKIARDVDSGEAPLESLEELYRDAIHMTTTAGRYLMHNAMRQAMDQPLSEKGFEKVEPELKAYLDKVLANGAP